jgi:L-ascorbate metabolism protein UlaG (beta-lactamase superfamily)
VVEVIWQGHACFELRGNENGLIIVHDPFKGVSGVPDPKAEADIILCSHSHGDHNNANAVKKKDSEVLEEFVGKKTLKGIEIKGIGTLHDEDRKGARGKNSVYVYQLEGIRFVHLGDLGHDLNADEVSAVGQVDVLFIPVGGFFTIGPDVATSIVDKLKPKINIPMHYRAPMMGGIFSSLKTLEDFTKGKENVQQIEGPSIQITKDTLPEVTTHVLLKFW